VPAPRAGTSYEATLSRLAAQLDTARALQAQGRFRASQTRIAELLGQLSRLPVDEASRPRIRGLEEQALGTMRGNLPYALSLDADIDPGEELDGLGSSWLTRLTSMMTVKSNTTHIINHLSHCPSVPLLICQTRSLVRFNRQGHPTPALGTRDAKARRHRTAEDQGEKGRR
jgi:hypothetical protein